MEKCINPRRYKEVYTGCRKHDMWIWWKYWQIQNSLNLGTALLKLSKLLSPISQGIRFWKQRPKDFKDIHVGVWWGSTPRQRSVALSWKAVLTSTNFWKNASTLSWISWPCLSLLAVILGSIMSFTERKLSGGPNWGKDTWTRKNDFFSLCLLLFVLSRYNGRIYLKSIHPSSSA